MLTTPEPIVKPVPSAMTHEEQLLEAIREQNVYLRKIDGKLGFFVFLTIVGLIISFLF
jgi:hypothetical protein